MAGTATISWLSGPIGNGYSFFKTVAIDKTKLGGADQTDFPLCVSGTYTYLKTTGNGGDVQNANGYDIIFTSDSAGLTTLKFEQVRYIASTGEVVYFVKVPTASSSVNTSIYMWYGNSSISTYQGDNANTWNANFDAVYHFPNGTVLSVADSKSNITLTNSGATATTGKVEGAANFNGTNQSITAGNNFAYTGDFTILLWSNATNIVSMLAKVSTGTGKANPIKLGYYGGTNKLGLFLGDGTNETISSSSTLQSASVWTHIGVKMVGTTYTFYFNGATDGSGTNAATRSNNAGITTTIGTNSGVGTEWYAGAIDEMYFLNVGVADSFVTALYNNQSSPATFYSIT